MRGSGQEREPPMPKYEIGFPICEVDLDAIFVRYKTRSVGLLGEGSGITTIELFDICEAASRVQMWDRLVLPWTLDLEKLGQLNVGDIVEFRVCRERVTESVVGKRSPCPIFWTLPGNLSSVTYIRIIPQGKADAMIPIRTHSTGATYELTATTLRLGDARGKFHRYAPSMVMSKYHCHGRRGPFGRTAAGFVYAWAQEPGRTREEIELARLYLAQWQHGPQLFRRIIRSSEAGLGRGGPAPSLVTP
jgi:hypothetical protein